MKTTSFKTLAACLVFAAIPNLLPAQVPNLVSHQGRVAVNGVNYNGTGQFKFALVNANGSTSYWSNDGSSNAGSEPVASVSLPVTMGLYSVLLGDTDIPLDAPSILNMLEVPASVFQNADVRLRVWFNDGVFGFQQLSPDQRLAPNGYLPTGAVASNSLADGSITNAKIAAGTVISSQTVAETSQTMAANTSYTAVSDSLTTFSLPGAANVGDVVEITGAGSGGWSVQSGNGQVISAPWVPLESNRNWQGLASSADGTKLVAVTNGDRIYTSSDSGASWTPRETSRNWRAVASSADGTKLVAVVDGGQIYTSTDSGATWTPRETSRNWRAVASSADGTKLVAVVVGGQIYTSTNSGATWTPRLANLIWRSVASSADGNRLVAVASDGQIYTSANSGASWSIRENIREWTSVASSVDGSKLVAAASLGQIYTSTDFGVNWTAREEDRNWSSVASSADGTKLVATVHGGSIYTSSDSGITWNPHGDFRWWWTVASSSDGSKLVAAENNGRIHISLDSGATWNAQENFRSWFSVISSADGSKLFAAEDGGNIYTPVTTASGGQGESITLTYLGNGQWKKQVPSNMALRSGGNAFTGDQTINGNVGIETTNPGRPLQIGDVGIPSSEGMMRFASRSGVGPANRYWDIGVPQGGETISGKFYSFVIDDPQLDADPEVVVRWDTGNVGIGVTDPVSKLDVDGTVTATAFNPTSDRNSKENFEPVNPREVLEKVAAMPISRWNFIGDAGTPHLGPMAQDFHAAFGTGTDDKHIATVDADGVALAAIQGLSEKLTEKDDEIRALRESNLAMERRLAALEEVLRSMPAAQKPSLEKLSKKP